MQRQENRHGARTDGRFGGAAQADGSTRAWGAARILMAVLAAGCGGAPPPEAPGRANVLAGADGRAAAQAADAALSATPASRVAEPTPWAAASVDPRPEVAGPDRAHGRYLVRFRDRALAARGAAATLAANETAESPSSAVGHLQIRRRFQHLAVVAVDATPAALGALIDAGQVLEWVEDSWLAPDVVASGDVGAALAVDAAAAWAEGFDGSGRAVAVVDTGVDASHAFFAGRVVAEACFADRCPDGSHEQIGPGAAAPCEFSARCAHGTHVAGIALGGGVDDAAREAGAAGVAPGASLVAIRVFSSTDEGCAAGESVPCPRARLSDVLRALEYVYDLRATQPIAAVNLSLGDGRYANPAECDRRDPAMKQMVDLLRDAGVATVASAGNSAYAGEINFPACISSALAIAATDGREFASFSNRAAIVALAAPGVRVMSSVPGGGYATMSGTSMAAPHVTGALAVLAQKAPGAGVDAVLERLRHEGGRVFDLVNGFSSPSLRVAPALAALDRAEGSCGCGTDADNVCSYATSSSECVAGAPGAYCDPDGNGDPADGDWERGAREWRARCAPQPSSALGAGELRRRGDFSRGFPVEPSSLLRGPLARART